MNIGEGRTQHIQADGTISHVVPKNGQHFTLPELNWFVGGNVEILRLTETQVMLINHHGESEPRKFNPLATAIAQSALKSDKLKIVGDVLVCPETQIERR